MASSEIKKYDVIYYGGGKNTTGYSYRAIIGLRRDDGSLIGAAYFHRDPATMPDTDEQSPSGYISCHYLWQDFSKVLDILRNEKPVYLEFVGGVWKQGSIKTSTEPVGEGEPT
ncbi:MAG: hypothetical protein ACREOW_15070 [Thermodesulfobacteriota bacterium]